MRTLIIVSAMAIALSFQQSPSRLAKQPVVKNRKAAAKSDQPKKGPAQESSQAVNIGEPKGKPDAQSKTEQHETNPDDRVYCVNLVSQPRDRLYPVYVIITAVAALIGLATLFVINRQTKQIRKSATAAKVAADAALLNAQALINAERAWLRETGPPQCQPASCALFVQNFGKSPAWIDSVGGSFQRIKSTDELPEIPEYGHINWGTVLPIRSEEKSSLIKITNEIKSAAAATVGTGDSKIAVFVCVKYRDRFRLAPTDEPYVLKFCYISESSILWRKDGPPAYNKAT